MTEKWYVADSYKDGKMVGEPFEDEKGKMKIRVRYSCGKCSGTGYVPFTVDNGICYDCGGRGYCDNIVRAYTEKEYASYRKAKERQQTLKEAKEQKAREEAEANSEKNKAEWLLNNGFTTDGFTFCYIGADSYARRAELKNNGFKYDSVLGWHIAETNIAEGVAKIAFDDVYTWNPYQKKGFYKTGAAEVIKEAKHAPKNEVSEFVGEIGERRRNQSLKVVAKFNYQNYYGNGYIIKFEDADKNLYCWFTNTSPTVEVNDMVNVDFSIKKHEVYNDEKVTYVTRCKISK